MMRHLEVCLDDDSIWCGWIIRLMIFPHQVMKPVVSWNSSIQRLLLKDNHNLMRLYDVIPGRMRDLVDGRDSDVRTWDSALTNLLYPSIMKYIYSILWRNRNYRKQFFFGLVSIETSLAEFDILLTRKRGHTDDRSVLVNTSTGKHAASGAL